MGPQKSSISSSWISQDVNQQAQMVFQDVRINVMQPYIKCKSYYDKKTNASKFKTGENVSLRR